MSRFATEREKLHDKVMTLSVSYGRTSRNYPNSRGAETLLASLQAAQHAYKAYVLANPLSIAPPVVQ